MGLYGPGTSVAAACGLSTCGSQAPEKGSILAVQGFRCSEAFAIFSDQGLYSLQEGPDCHNRAQTNLD